MENIPGRSRVSIGPEDDSTKKQAEIAAAASAVDEGQGVVVVTDLYGGTPANLALGACKHSDRTMLYGANMPMLVKLAQARRMSMADAVACALSAGRKYINCVDGFTQDQRPIAL